MLHKPKRNGLSVI